ncbi:MAG TPA: serine/threonine-protein kinase [Nostocaceae cyanobacterium]|nr:serine/threonine-protein kinase [Nostocaceae cyanobacterium]
MKQQSDESDIYIGKLLNSRYLLKKVIGKGGMGRVYLAEDIAKGGMLVAVKILMVSIINQQMSHRFGREIFISAQLGRKSKNIVRVLSYGVTDEQIPYYVMEYLQGKNLKDILKLEYLSLPKFLEISQQICLGLYCAHQGVSYKGKIYPVVHRDIKPENILIDEDAKKSEMVKILDFGIAKFLTERSGITLTDSFIGSLPYCSPEHMEGQKILDVRSDIYSLGVLMFEMITGRHPFYTTSKSFGTWYQLHRFQPPPTFAEVNSQVQVPQELQKLVIRCLAKEIEDRPQSVSEILDTLVQVQKELDHEPRNTSYSLVSNSEKNLVLITTLSEKACLEKTWPKNKPISLIGFPHLLHTTQGIIPTFWAMLPQAEIAKFIQKKHITEFISKVNLYPMVLWVTMLYDFQSSLNRWLSYYLDLKDPRGQKLVMTLAEMGYYHLLFFSLEEPERCSHVITLTLTSDQRQQLADYINLSQTTNPLVLPKQAKNLLKTEYEKVKLEILQKLASNQKNDTTTTKSWIAKLFDNLF